MVKVSRKLLCLCLSVLLIVGCLSACSPEENTPATTSETEATTVPTTEPAPTEPEEEAKILKVLNLGNSASVDSNHMINLVAATEGIGQYEEIVIGSLYYSGCKLYQHVNFLKSNSPVYTLYISSTKTPDRPPETTDGMTMEMALRFDYWDIIVLQAGSSETNKESNLTNGNIQTIQNYVNEKKLNPLAYFAWHFTGAPASDPDLLNMYPYDPNPYIANMAEYNNDRLAYFAARAVNIEKYIFTDETIKLVICSGTAALNAYTSYMTEKELIRDYTHATDFTRVMLSYVWYAKLMGITEFEELKLDAIPKVFLKSTVEKTGPRVLTEEEKAIMLESVNNALKNPLEMTQSQYTEKP